MARSKTSGRQLSCHNPAPIRSTTVFEGYLFQKLFEHSYMQLTMNCSMLYPKAFNTFTIFQPNVWKECRQSPYWGSAKKDGHSFYPRKESMVESCLMNKSISIGNEGSASLHSPMPARNLPNILTTCGSKCFPD